MNITILTWISNEKVLSKKNKINNINCLITNYDLEPNKFISSKILPINVKK